MPRNFTDEDLEKLGDIITNNHQCHFKPEAFQSLAEFSKQIEDPKVRQGIVSVGEAYNETSSMVRRWLIRGFFILSLIASTIVAWPKIMKGLAP